MRKAILILGMVLLPMEAVSPLFTPPLSIPAPRPIKPYEQLWEATCMVESSNNPMAYNAKEQAVGISQIRPIRLLDYFQRTGRAYSMDDLYDIAISKEIYMYYASRSSGNLESIAKSWNGRGKSNIQYWNKVKALL